ncbi:MAG TPA: hypothetical protein VEW42_00555 [Candidatus Eisenbacteria bacterium]|nr:hypothetical protein [Candidatus Eisenbacteria bacterium]
MAGKRIVFIIPGFRQKPTQIAYRKIAKFLKSEGYFPVPITIHWKETTISENTEYFLKAVKKKLLQKSHRLAQDKKEKIYFLGFSYGAMIALLASTKIKVNGLVLCSLSPFFKEDLPKKISKNTTALQERRYKIFSTLSARLLAKKVKAAQVCMLYGSDESKPLIARVTKTFQHIPSNGKYLLSIQNVTHNIADKKYMTAIHYATKTFL